MAGKPIMRRFEQTVEAEGGPEAIFSRIRAGETIAQVMESYDLSRQTFYNWLKRGGEERRERYEQVKAVSADNLVDEAKDILDDAENPATTADVTAAKARADFRQWLASVRDRDRYGEKNPASVNVNVGNVEDLHLDALRQSGSMEPHREPEGDGESRAIQEADYEMVEEPDGDTPRAADESPGELAGGDERGSGDDPGS